MEPLRGVEMPPWRVVDWASARSSSAGDLAGFARAAQGSAG